LKQNDPVLPEEIEAEALIHKANLLLERHRPGFRTSRAPEPEDDLPILTEIFEVEPPPEVFTAYSHPPGRTPPSELELAEQLISLETVITKALEDWFKTELPPIIAHEIERLNRRIHEEALAHLRTTLLPKLSDELANHLAHSMPHPDEVIAQASDT